MSESSYSSTFCQHWCCPCPRFWCVEVSHRFNLHFLMTYIRTSFPVLFCNLCIFFLLRSLFSLWPIFNQVFCFLMSFFLSFNSFCIFWMTGFFFLIIFIFCKYFLPVCGLSSYGLDIVCHRKEVFHFNEAQFINYFF